MADDQGFDARTLPRARPSFRVFNAYIQSGGDYTYNSGPVKAVLSDESFLSSLSFVETSILFISKADFTSTSPACVLLQTSLTSDLP